MQNMIVTWEIPRQTILFRSQPSELIFRMDDFDVNNSSALQRKKELKQKLSV